MFRIACIVLLALLVVNTASAQNRQVEAMTVRAMTRLYVGDYEDALDILQKASEIEPDNAVILDLMADAAFRAGDPASAVLHAREAVRLDPANESFSIRLARILAARNEWSEAVTVLQETAGRNPESVEPLMLLGSIQAAAEQLGAALETYLAVAERITADRDLYDRIVQLERRLGRTDDEIQTLSEMIARWPGEAGLHADLGAAYARAGQAAQSSEAFAKALELDPRDERARAALAHETVVEFAPDAARKMEAVAQSNPRDEAAWTDAVILFWEAGMSDEAIRVADEAGLFYPGNVTVTFIRCAAMMDQGSVEAAGQCFNDMATTASIAEEREAAAIGLWVAGGADGAPPTSSDAPEVIQAYGREWSARRSGSPDITGDTTSDRIATAIILSQTDTAAASEIVSDLLSTGRRRPVVLELAASLGVSLND